MFELSVARKYLTPSWRQLSVSIISVISILVIALVVWLIVVFFSVTTGLEKSWIDKLIALTAPVRATPTPNYYHSYYYRIDSLSSQSDYTLKNLREKLQSPTTNPYDPDADEEIPYNWPKPDLDLDGKVKDIVKLAFQAIDRVPGVQAKDFEMTGSNINLRLLRNISHSPTVSMLNQHAYLGSFDPDNRLLSKALIPLTIQDLNNLYSMSGIASDNQQESDNDIILKAPKDLMQARLQTFFSAITIQELVTPETGWILPRSMLPQDTLFHAYAITKDKHLTHIVLPATQGAPIQGSKSTKITVIILKNTSEGLFITKPGEQPQPLPKYLPIILPGGIKISAKLDAPSILTAHTPFEVVFGLEFNLQGTKIHGKSPIGHLLIQQADIAKFVEEEAESLPLWITSVINAQNQTHMALPSDPFNGDGIILPRPFREAGVSVGDRGYLAYATPTTSSVQEQRIPVFVAGFYEPGVIPIGGKFILVNQQITTLIRSSNNQDESPLSNGINIRVDDIKKADQIKAQLQQDFKEAGIDSYWKIETYKDYDFTKDLIQQLRSEKNLFTLLATIIIIVACSNIISMLIILVNDKKLEIGILRSMGATSASIAIIFGACGMIMGFTGSLLGMIAAIATLGNLQPLINLISRIQGYEMFNPLFFGDTLPAELSYEALGFVVLATAMISLVAGLVPAVKASLMKPSTILRAE